MSGPARRVLADTNVLLYAEDASEPEKQPVAASLIETLIRRDALCLSAQVLAEFFSAGTRRLARPMRVETARVRIEQYRAAGTEVVPVTDRVVASAVAGVIKYELHYYDAQIWATAKLNGIDTVLSEDFTDGSEIEGVRFVDPFSARFDLDATLGL